MGPDELLRLEAAKIALELVEGGHEADFIEAAQKVLDFLSGQP